MQARAANSSTTTPNLESKFPFRIPNCHLWASDPQSRLARPGNIPDEAAQKRRELDHNPESGTKNTFPWTKLPLVGEERLCNSGTMRRSFSPPHAPRFAMRLPAPCCCARVMLVAQRSCLPRRQPQHDRAQTASRQRHAAFKQKAMQASDSVGAWARGHMDMWERRHMDT